jgi:AcrR family transcriptional regulator
MANVRKQKGTGSRATALRKADPRGDILRAAWGLIRHYGYHKTTIGDIAREAGLGKGTIYLYFRSKEEIMLGLVDLTSARIAEDQERIAARTEPAPERLRACLLHRVMTLYDIVQRYPHGEEIIGSLMPAIVELLEAYVRREGVLLAALVHQGCAAGDLAVKDPDTTGALLAELFEFLTPPYYRFRSRRALESFTNQVFDQLITGLRGRTARRPSPGKKATDAHPA